MGPGPDEKYLEQSGYLTPNKMSVALPGALKMASRFIPLLSIGLLVALLAGAFAFYSHGRLADDRLETAHRHALRSAIEQFGVARNTAAVDAQTLQLLEGL